MSKPVGDGMAAPDLTSEQADDAAAIVALAVSAISGFLMGLILQGTYATAFTIAALVPTLGLAGWWLRGVVDDGRHVESAPPTVSPASDDPGLSSHPGRCLADDSPRHRHDARSEAILGSGTKMDGADPSIASLRS